MYRLIQSENTNKIIQEKGNTLIVFLVLLFISGSCGKLTDQDSSLSLKEYRSLGMPEYSRLWNYEDYKSACNTLDYIKAQKPFSQPYGTNRGGFKNRNDAVVLPFVSLPSPDAGHIF